MVGILCETLTQFQDILLLSETEALLLLLLIAVWYYRQNPSVIIQIGKTILHLQVVVLPENDEEYWTGQFASLTSLDNITLEYAVIQTESVRGRLRRWIRKELKKISIYAARVWGKIGIYITSLLFLVVVILAIVHIPFENGRYIKGFQVSDKWRPLKVVREPYIRPKYDIFYLSYWDIRRANINYGFDYVWAGRKKPDESSFPRTKAYYFYPIYTYNINEAATSFEFDLTNIE